MEVTNMDIPTLISSIGFPITACIGLAYFCKLMIDKNNDNLNRMFEIYDRANAENREAIKACTEAINKLCDRLEDEDK